MPFTNEPREHTKETIADHGALSGGVTETLSLPRPLPSLYNHCGRLQHVGTHHLN